MNIHTVHEGNNRNRNGPNQGGAQGGNYQRQEANPAGNGPPPLSKKALLYFQRSGLDQEKNPRQENFWDMLHLTFCPTFKFSSFLFFITLVNIGFFIAEIINDGINTQGDLLEINPGSLILNLGMRPSQITEKYQLWRLVTPIFLHLSLSHIFMNSFTLIFWGSLVEFFIGWKKTAVLYLVSGVCGNFLSAAISDDNKISVGASGAICGVIFAMLGMFILAWRALGHPALLQFREMACCMIMILIMFNVLFMGVGSKDSTKSSLQVDHYAHLGGGLGGIFLSMWMLSIELGIRDDPAVIKYEKKVKVVGAVLLGVFFLVTSINLFLLKKTQNN